MALIDGTFEKYTILGISLDFNSSKSDFVILSFLSSFN